MYRTVSAGMRTGWFIGPYIWNLAINFGANYGLEYGTLCQWGKDAMVDMYDAGVRAWVPANAAHPSRASPNGGAAAGKCGSWSTCQRACRTHALRWM